MLFVIFVKDVVHYHIRLLSIYYLFGFQFLRPYINFTVYASVCMRIAVPVSTHLLHGSVVLSVARNT